MTRDEIGEVIMRLRDIAYEREAFGPMPFKARVICWAAACALGMLTDESAAPADETELPPELSPPVPPPAAAAPAKHRHKYGADGACAELVEGKVCGAVSRAAKKAAAAAPAAPAAGGSTP
jgi:hypothetical protein